MQNAFVASLCWVKYICIFSLLSLLLLSLLLILLSHSFYYETVSKTVVAQFPASQTVPSGLTTHTREMQKFYF